MENRDWLKNLPLDFEHWEQYADTEPFLIEKKFPVPGLRQVCYQKETPSGVVSAGAFTLHGRPTHIAWGLKAETHCSFHKVFRADGTWGEPVAGCADTAALAGCSIPTGESNS
jgi:hypothetical protein